MFDKIPREHVWSSTRKMGVHEGMIQAVMSTLLNTECVLHVEGVAKAVKMRQGSAQGTSLGPDRTALLGMHPEEAEEPRGRRRREWNGGTRIGMYYRR
jgi:hypothetical protein